MVQSYTLEMRRLLAVVLLVAALTLSAPAKIPLDEFAARRASLRKSLDGVLVLFAQSEGKDEVFRVPPEPNFYYLTGWNQPGAVLLLTPTEELLFLPHHDLHTEQFHGKRASAEDAGVQSLTGFEVVFPREKFESELSKAMSAHEKVYAAFDQPGVEYGKKLTFAMMGRPAFAEYNRKIEEIRQRGRAVIR